MLRPHLPAQAQTELVKWFTVAAMNDPETIRRQLATAGRRRERARAEVAKQSAAIALIAPQAIGLGLTKTEVCRLAQISRPALDAMLKH